MSQRDQIKMSPAEVTVFLAEERVVTVATTGPDGRTHLAPLWYGFIDGCIAFSTYGRSQKVRNIKRDPAVTVLVEGGHEYGDLRGVEIFGTAELIDDPGLHEELARSIGERYYANADSAPQHGDVSKRTVVRIIPEKTVSWDHRKLAAAEAG